MSVEGFWVNFFLKHGFDINYFVLGLEGLKTISKKIWVSMHIGKVR